MIAPVRSVGRAATMGRRVVRRAWHGARLAERPVGVGLRALVPISRRDPRRRDRFRIGPYPFVARPIDWYAIEDVVVRDEYAFVAPLLHGLRRPVVVDLGANIGLFSLYVLRLAPDAVVHALEASPTTFEVLAENRRLNPGLEWTCHHLAAHDHDGTIRLTEAAVSTGSRVEDGGSGPQVRAASLATVLGSLVDTPVDLLKVDVEGAEERVLGAGARLLAGIRHTVVEIHPGVCDHDAVVDVLGSSYDYLYRGPRDGSSYPLVVATRERLALDPYV